MKRKISDIILPNYWDLVEDGIGDQLERSRKLFLRGGRFSGKSYWAGHHIILTLMELAAVHKEGDPWACCLALRKYSNTLKTSVYAEIANAIINLGVEDKWQMLTNPMEIRLKGTKTVIKFANLNTAEDYGKVKSIKWPGGYCRLIWFEEADQFMSKHDVDQVLLSLYRGGDIFETIFTYNTPFSPSHWLNIGWHNEREMITEGDGSERAIKEKVYFKHVNLYDIPKGIVPDQVYDMAEAMRLDNEKEWRHVIMGDVGDPATMVFPLLKAVRAGDVDYSEFGMGSECWRWFVGMDYGYRPDPTVCVVVGYNRIKKVLWIIDETRGIGWSEDGIYLNVIEMLRRGGGAVAKGLGAAGGYVVNISSLINSEIDNRIIDGLRSKGLNIYPVKKVSGSRDISYQFLTGGYGDVKEIWIDPEMCPGCWAEFIGAEFQRRDIAGKEIIIQEWPSVEDHRDRPALGMQQLICGWDVLLLEARGRFYRRIIMIGDMFNMNKRKDVRTREDQVMYYGKKYRREKDTGYYVCTTGERKRLHDALWMQENIDGIKEIPEGHVIHHIDWNKTHNEISNLTCVSVFGHNLIHNPPKGRK